MADGPLVSESRTLALVGKERAPLTAMPEEPESEPINEAMPGEAEARMMSGRYKAELAAHQERERHARSWKRRLLRWLER